MRHGDKIKNLSRTASHRAALLSNLTAQLIQYKRITTTLAKAKALRVYAEPIITRSKNDTMHNRRIVFSYLQDKESIKELFGVISDKVADRPGGYTRIIKLPRRIGDAADMAMIELVDFNTIYGKDTEAAAAKKTRRSRRSSGAKATTETSTPAPVAAAEETIVEANETIETTEVTETTEATEVTETTTEVTETTTEATETTTEENNA
jgi:large subunit ribosomal protein L17